MIRSIVYCLVPVNQWLGLRLVEEQQARADLGRYLEPQLPGEGRGPPTAEESVF